MDYAGLKVLDLSQGIAGPYCATLLAQQGADVIKVEPPSGDWGRGVGAAREGISAVALVGNAGKRAIALDAARPEAQALLLRMAERADVVVQNYRPGVIERLGLGYAAVAARNPALVYLSITGFGADGPEASRPATDSVLQSLAGLAWLNRDADGTPRRFPLLIPDTVTALYAAQAVGAALFARMRTGRGRHVQMSLLEACAAFQAMPILDAALFPGKRVPLTVPSGVFRTADGWLTLVSVNETTFRGALRALGLDAWIDDARFALPAARQRHADALNLEVARILAGADSAHWTRRLVEEDALFAPIQDYDGLRAMEQAKCLGLFDGCEQPSFGQVPLARQPGAAPGWQARPAPRIGEHADEILRQLGLDGAEIEALAACGALFRPPAAS